MERMLRIAKQNLDVLAKGHPPSVRRVFYCLLDPTLPARVLKRQAAVRRHAAGPAGPVHLACRPFTIPRRTSP